MKESAVSDQRSGESARPAIFDAYPGLIGRLPWIPIGQWPTPISEVSRLSEAKGLRAVYFKREDLSHPECGGNKVRGLEILLADAQRRGAKRIVTLSAAGSHHIVKTAWHAGSLGIDTVGLVVPQPPAEYVRVNLLIGAALGVRYVPCNYVTLPVRLAVELLRGHLPSAGATPPDGGTQNYYIPPGGTSPLSVIGHVSAALELRQQVDAGRMPEPDYIYVALGSLGTAAGLAAGCALAGLRCRLVGVVTSHRWYCTRGRWARLARRTLGLLRRFDGSVPWPPIRTRDFIVIGTALGEGYGHRTAESMELAAEAAALEQLHLDQTYTAKVLHGALEFIARERLQDRVHLFWHTFSQTNMPPTDRGGRRELPRALERYL